MNPNDLDKENLTNNNNEQAKDNTSVITPAVLFPETNRKKNNYLKKTSLILFTILLLVMVFIGGNYLAARLASNDSVDKVKRVAGNGFLELPKDISVDQAKKPTAKQASKIFKEIRDFVNKTSSSNSGIAVSLTKNGETISSNPYQVQNASSSTAYAAEENTNSYILADPPDNTFQAWTDAQKILLNETIKRAYALNVELYGPPASNDTVNIYRQDNPTVGNGYYAPWGTNGTMTIVLSSNCTDECLTTNLAHEMSHSFRSNYIFSNRGWEEGMAMLSQNLYDKQYFSKYFQITSDQYMNLNQPSLSVPLFYDQTVNQGASNSIQDRYFAAGYAMADIYVQNKDYLKNFVQNYYQKSRSQTDLSESDIRKIFIDTVPSVEGENSTSWLYDNYILINDYNKSQNLVLAGGNIYYFENPITAYGNRLPYVNAKITETVSKLDDTQVLSNQLNTDDKGFVENSLIGKVPESGFYGIHLIAEAKEGAAASEDYVRYIPKDKLLGINGNVIFGYTNSVDDVIATATDGTKLTSKVSDGIFVINDVKDMQQYTLSQGDKTLLVNLVGAPYEELGFISGTKNGLVAPKDATIEWTNPSEVNPDPIKGSILVFKDGQVSTDKPYINICASINGGYIADSVSINNSGVILNKGSFCKYFDLNNGVNKFTIKVTSSDGKIITSDRIINSTNTTKTTYESLVDLTGGVYTQNDTANQNKVSIYVYIEASSTDVSTLNGIIYGVSINGNHYNPNRNPNDRSVTAAFYQINATDVTKSNQSTGILYSNEINANLSQYPFRSGNNKICLTIDPLNGVEESDENNNDICQYVTAP
ncbi:MAG: hypothetical protein NTV39_02605 [Candidatus Saccharibacteria bacterium]|nr:hypothetical protein [Candidatus Saccharibacteria bacterium]